MFGHIHHVGYLALDLEAAIQEFPKTFGLGVVRRFDRPQFSLRGAFLGTEEVSQIEVFTFTDGDLLNRRLAGSSLMLDHVAFEVDDIDGTALALRHAGVRFSGPDLRDEVQKPNPPPAHPQPVDIPRDIMWPVDPDPSAHIRRAELNVQRLGQLTS